MTFELARSLLQFRCSFVVDLVDHGGRSSPKLSSQSLSTSSLFSSLLLILLHASSGSAAQVQTTVYRCQHAMVGSQPKQNEQWWCPRCRRQRSHFMRRCSVCYRSIGPACSNCENPYLLVRDGMCTGNRVCADCAPLKRAIRFLARSRHPSLVLVSEIACDVL